LHLRVESALERNQTLHAENRQQVFYYGKNPLLDWSRECFLSNKCKTTHY
jgi:hypothetical protein